MRSGSPAMVGGARNRPDQTSGALSGPNMATAIEGPSGPLSRWSELNADSVLSTRRFAAVSAAPSSRTRKSSSFRPVSRAARLASDTSRSASARSSRIRHASAARIPAASSTAATAAMRLRVESAFHRVAARTAREDRAATAAGTMPGLRSHSPAATAARETAAIQMRTRGVR